MQTKKNQDLWLQVAQFRKLSQKITMMKTQWWNTENAMARWPNCNDAWMTTWWCNGENTMIWWWKREGAMVKMWWHDGESVMARWWNAMAIWRNSAMGKIRWRDGDDIMWWWLKDINATAQWGNRDGAMTKTRWHDDENTKKRYHDGTMMKTRWFDYQNRRVNDFTIAPWRFQHCTILVSPSWQRLYHRVFTIVVLCTLSYI